MKVTQLLGCLRCEMVSSALVLFSKGIYFYVKESYVSSLHIYIYMYVCELYQFKQFFQNNNKIWYIKNIKTTIKAMQSG